MDKTHFIAFDLGATSGRCILGSLSETGLELKELYRFPNRILHIGDRFFWNIFSLYEHILDGLKAASKENVHITSIGIDTWGVDIVCIGKDGDILGLPRSYRDPYTENIPEEFFCISFSYLTPFRICLPDKRLQNTPSHPHPDS